MILKINGSFSELNNMTSWNRGIYFKYSLSYQIAFHIIKLINFLFLDYFLLFETNTGFFLKFKSYEILESLFNQSIF